MAAFGWWFASGRFEDKWAVNRLIESLEVGGDTDDKPSVVERLATLAPQMPYQSAHALHLIVKDAEYLRVYYFADEAKELLRSLLDSDSEEAKKQARDTIDCLLNIGHRDFRDLLKNSGI